MFCHKCGAKNNEDSRFCKECGESISDTHIRSASMHDNKNIVDNFMAVLGKYAEFKGRASRREYWMFYLAYMVIFMALYLTVLIFARGLGLGKIFIFIPQLLSLFILIPSIAVSVRRLHDTGHSAWFLLINLIPIVGPIVFIVVLATDGDHGNNSYGHNPKRV